jgi:hypothetical protein
MRRAFGTNVLPSQRRPVAWYSPPVLYEAGRQVVSAEDFQRNADRREGFTNALPVIDESAAGGDASGHNANDTFGVDFFADTGDGGNATFTVAQAAMAPVLNCGNDVRLPRGQLVVLGGDLAYPGANSHDYHYRFLEVFSLARPRDALGAPLPSWTTAAAIPQNHDWMDSASTFCRYFLGRKAGEFVGTRTPQDRTYFAVRLPHRWWILGLDFAHKGDLDRTQFEAFQDLWATCRPGPRIEPGDNVILVYPEPYWTRQLDDSRLPGGYTRRFQRLEHLIQAPPGEGAGARIRLRLAGDFHHYARHSIPLAAQPSTDDNAGTGGRQEAARAACAALAVRGPQETAVVTCGTGGAFLHGTHGPEVQQQKILDETAEPDTEPESLGRRVRLGIQSGPATRDATQAAGSASQSPTQTGRPLTATVTYPTAAQSRRLALKGLPFSMFFPRLTRPWPSSPAEWLSQLWNSNLGFCLCLGLLYGLSAYVNSIAFLSTPLLQGATGDAVRAVSLEPTVFNLQMWIRATVFSPFAVLVNVIMIGGCVRTAWDSPSHGLFKSLSGIAHGLIHGLAVFALYSLVSPWVHGFGDATPNSTSAAVATWAVVGACGTVVGGVIFGLYFAVANGLFGQLTNNAFGALAIEDFKGFLRMSVSTTGLTVRYVACDTVPKRWRIDERGVQVSVTPAVWRVVDKFTIPS